MAATKKSKNRKKLTAKKAAKRTSFKEPPIVAELRRQLAESFQREAATAREKARYFQEQQARTREIEALHDVTAAASQSLELKPVFDEVVKKISEIFKFNAAGIYLFDPERQEVHLQASFGMGEIAPRALRRGQGLTGMVAETVQPIIFENVKTDARYEQLSLSKSTRDHDYSFFAIFPIRAKGICVGTINCLAKLPRQISSQEVRLITSMSDQIGVAVENINLYAELKGKTAELESSNSQLREALEHQTATSEVLGIISRSPTDVQPVLDAIVESAARVCGIDDVLLRLHEGEKAIVRAHFGPLAIVRREISSDEPRFHWMREHGTLHVPDIRERNELQVGPSGTWRTLLSVPLCQHGEFIGALAARRTEVHPFSEAQIKLLETFADQAVIAIENARLFRELKESLEQQTATSEILGVIASSPTDIQPVLDTVAKNAARLCEAADAQINRLEGDGLRRVASYGSMPTPYNIGEVAPINRDHVGGRAIIDRQTIHVHDITAEFDTEFPQGKELQERSGARTLLATPLLREGDPIGLIVIRRSEVRPFTARQITLLKTFADQAVIAIENVRLFKELQERNAELREALEHQTATAEVLGIISRSPTDVQPVLDAIVESAARVCSIDDLVLHLVDGSSLISRAHFGSIPVPTSRAKIGIDDLQFRWMREHGTLHIPDVNEENDFQIMNVSGWRTFLAVPLHQHEQLIGGMTARRIEMFPFTPAQIKLLETFADQAVIALENVRLFQELREALEQQTATSEILGVIASSPTDIQPVLNVVAKNAAHLCEAVDAVITRPEGDRLRVVAKYGALPVPEYLPLSRGFPGGRAVIDGKIIHIHDITAEIETQYPEAKVAQQVSGTRTVLNMPLLKEGVAIGGIGVRRIEVRPFTEKQIAILKTFASQAVIAIENVRLFKELQERNAELREALEHQTATAEVLGIISRSPTDVQPVLDAIVESAARVCGIDDVVLRLTEGDAMVWRAHFGSITEGRVEVGIDEPISCWLREQGTLHVPDAKAPNAFPVGTSGLFHSLLAVPLRQQGELIGSLNARRTEMRPFTPTQIKLLETFADQAVIAIENVRLFKELKESLEQQTATSEILGVIASSPTDIQPVLDVVAENAARLCEANDAQISRVEGELFGTVASFGPLPPTSEKRPLTRTVPSGRAIIDRETIHIPDLEGVREKEFPDARGGRRPGHTPLVLRTVLATPLLREGSPIGAIVIRRLEVRPFTEKQISLLKTFAAQAVIAIENVRLFRELQERNAELREALEHQTATAEVLGIISRSPTDVQPVLDAIVQSAARVCGIDDVELRLCEGSNMISRAHFGSVPIGRREIDVDELQFRWLREHGTLHVPDVFGQSDFPTLGPTGNFRSYLAAPLRQHGEFVGGLFARRSEVRPFTPAQIKLLETFADQAVIAIENVRLFQELEAKTVELARSVSELKALGEVGQAVSSTLDLETVLTRIVSHAVQLSGTDGGAIYEYDEQSEEFQLRATDHMEEELITALRTNPPRLGDGLVGKAALNRQPIEVPDISQELAYPPRMRQMLSRYGFKASLAVPLLREERIIGALVIRRKSTGSFSPAVIELLKTFATQSVLAIQNARLFREIEDKSREIETANRHKSEFLANMSHELRTPLTAIIGFSEVLSDKIFGELNEKQDEYIGDIVSSGRHLLSLINDILDLSKVEAGRMDLDLTKFDVPMAIENALILIRERATRHGIKVHHRIDERLGEVVGDERKFKQILLNLLSNAVKFTSEGGRIDIDAVLSKDSVEILVSDTGIGIAPEHQETIFEEFRQVGTDASKKREGTGLGLTLTKKFVEVHGGTIRVESVVGKGSTFTFTLPLNQENVHVAGISPDH
jgi:GAF domain-containing protein/anti-sigma regulatory factor (Ser/Thr protein kinase)